MVKVSFTEVPKKKEEKYLISFLFLFLCSKSPAAGH